MSFLDPDLRRDDLWLLNSKETSAEEWRQHSWKRGADAVREALVLAVLDMPDRRISNGDTRIDEMQFRLARDEIVRALRAR
jgi:hypothetical protein